MEINNHYLKEKNILITGASSGIGKSLAINLSKLGANILMLSRNETALDSIYDEIKEKYKTDPCILKCDLENLDDNKSREILNIISDSYQNLDAVIHNASLLEKMSDIQSYESKTWEKILKVNLTSSFMLSKYLMPIMQSSPNPRIIFTTSSVGNKGKAFWGAYSVSKAGINALSEILADELESVSNIKIFNFNPKATQTPMRALAYPAEDPALVKKADDLMDYYLWMLSEESSKSENTYIEFDKSNTFI